MSKITRFSALSICALAPLVMATAAGGDTTSRQKPNIVLILMDDMGYGDIAPFGSKVNPTPNLSRMASEGMKLTSFYCAPVCSASRTQLLTGCYNKRAGVPDVLFPGQAAGLSPEENTISSLLKPLGYATMCIGKWHLGDQPLYLPTSHGFDHYVGLPYSNDMNGTGKPDKKGKVLPPLPLVKDLEVIEAPVAVTKVTKLYTDEAVQFITKNKNNPFFLYLPHNAIHHPLQPGVEFAGKSPHGLYSDWICEADWSVGRILDTLKELHIDQNTLVIFTSDNGSLSKDGGSNAPLRGGKFSTWEGGMREPALVWWPGKIQAGAVRDGMCSELDILPTVLGLAGGQLPSDRKIDGVDLWPFLSGQTETSPRESLYYWFWGNLEAVRHGSWKLAIATQKGGHGAGGESNKNSEEAEEKTTIAAIGDKRNKKGDKISKEEKSEDTPATVETPRLYNLDNDIAELTDVASQYPDVVKSLQNLVKMMDGDLGLTKTKRDPAPGVRVHPKVDNPKPMLLKSGETEKLLNAAEYN